MRRLKSKEKGRKGGLTIAPRSGESDQPPNGKNGDVVVHVKEGNLTEVRLQGHDQGVHKLDNLGGVEDPDDASHGDADLVVNGVSPEGVATQNS